MFSKNQAHPIFQMRRELKQKTGKFLRAGPEKNGRNGKTNKQTKIRRIFHRIFTSWVQKSDEMILDHVIKNRDRWHKRVNYVISSWIITL